jgi:hypothetical protein
MISAMERRACAGGGHVDVDVTIDGRTRTIHYHVDDPAPDDEEVAAAVRTLVLYEMSKRATRQEKRDVGADFELVMARPTR